MSPRQLRNEDKNTAHVEKHKVRQEDRNKKRSERLSRHDEEDKSPEISPKRVTRHSVHFDSPSTIEDISKPISNSDTPEKSSTKTTVKKHGSFKRKYRKNSTPTAVVKSEVRDESWEQMNGMGPSSPAEQNFKSSTFPVISRNGYGSEGSSDLLDSVLSWQLYPMELRKTYNIMPSQIYGAAHLLRLFGR